MKRAGLLVLLPLLAGSAQFNDAAEAARKAGDANAPALYQRALRADPKWEQGWWALGTLYYEKDRYAECADAFRRLTELEPKAGAAQTMLGLCDASAKKYDSAAEHLKRGLELGPGSDAIARTARYQLARLYTHAGLFEPAMTLLAELAAHVEETSAYDRLAGAAALWHPVFPEDVDSSDRELVFLAGKAFWQAAARNASDAQKSFEELLARYPNTPGVHYLYGSFEIRDNPDGSIAEFEAELKINPGHPGALSALAAEYLRRGDTARGMPYAKKLLEAAPDGLASHALMGRLLADSGDTAGAVRELEAARAIDPSDPQPHIALASLYAKLGRGADAARERQAFLKARSPAQ